MLKPGTHFLHVPSGKKFILERGSFLRLEGTETGHWFEGGLPADYVSLPCYRLAETPGWCITHKRPATYTLSRVGIPDVQVCDPKLSGIMIPCNT
jgi:hypothetical protein